MARREWQAQRATELRTAQQAENVPVSPISEAASPIVPPGTATAVASPIPAGNVPAPPIPEAAAPQTPEVLRAHIGTVPPTPVRETSNAPGASSSGPNPQAWDLEQVWTYVTGVEQALTLRIGLLESRSEFSDTRLAMTERRIEEGFQRFARMPRARRCRSIPRASSSP